MAGNGLVVRVRITGVRETLRACRELPDDAQRELRDRSKALAESLAVQIRAAAVSDSGQSALMAPTVRARRDRVPVIVAGGPKRVGRNRKPAHKILFGSEFGSNALRQFRPHRGASSYWFFRTVEDNSARIDREWNAAASDVLARWGRS